MDVALDAVALAGGDVGVESGEVGQGIRERGIALRLVPKNWHSFQHYKDRDPTWIKLHKKLLDDYEFQRLPIASKALAPMLWLLASEQKNGEFEADPEKLAFRLRWNVKDIEGALTPLIESGFFFPVQPASNALALIKPDASPETYKPETENPIARKEPEEPEGFQTFWRAWPKSERKIDRCKCAAYWRREKLEPLTATIIEHVGRSAKTRKWTTGYEPAPLTYLRGRRWNDPIESGPDGRSGNGVAL